MKPEKCRHLLGSLSEYIDGALEEQLCTQLELHLADCPDCRIVVDTLNMTVSLYKQSADQASVPDDVRQRLFRCLNLDDLLGNPKTPF